MDTGRRIRGEGTWAAARAAYLDGAAAADVCERFGLGLSALRLRARREGWRRADQPDADPDLEEPDDAEGPGAPPREPGEAAAQAWARADAAVARGRLREAQGWTRLWRELTAAADARVKAHREQASAEHRAATDDACHAAKAIIAAYRPAPNRAGARETSELHSLHSLHSVHPVSERTPEEADRPLNRAERRRRERLAAARLAKERPAKGAAAAASPHDRASPQARGP